MIDGQPLGDIEYEYGMAAYEDVRQRLFKLLAEQGGKDYRSGDLLTLDVPRGLRFILFLDRKRRRTLPFTPADLKAARLRLLHPVVSNVARAAFPYLKADPVVELGVGLAIHNPLVHPERILNRALRDSLDDAAHVLGRQRREQLSLRREHQHPRVLVDDVRVLERVHGHVQRLAHGLPGD